MGASTASPPTPSFARLPEDNIIKQERKNGGEKARLSPRGKAAKQFHDLGYEEWKEEHDYGKRWSVEGVFSAIKRCENFCESH